MKQSTKLLSLLLALVMAFSCMSVIGNAALDKSQVTWDNIDDAHLSAEQVAELALDLVDNDLLAGMKPIELSILGELRLDSIDHICADVDELYNGWVWGAGSGLLGDLGRLKFDAIAGKSRSQGDLQMVLNVLNLIGNDNNSAIIAEAAYGISDDGLSLGLVGNFLDLGDIGDMLNDIPGLLKSLVYDMIIYGSYGYEKSFEELGNKLPAGATTLDEMVAQAIGGLLAYPQDYHYENGVKVWHDDAILLPTLAATGIDNIKSMTKITENSILGLVDKIAPYALYDLGINALNNNLKKALLEAVEVEFVEVDVTTLPGYAEEETKLTSVAKDFEILAEDGKESYVNYIAYDRIYQDGSTFYYTTLKNETMMNGDEPVLDEEGNEQSVRIRKYYKANTATANDFYELIDFGWDFVAPAPGAEEDDDAFALDNLSAINYKALIDEYGSIMESLNHLLYVVFETAVKQDVKDYFAEMTGDYWVDGATTEKYADGTSVFMDNASRLLKYLLAEHADKIFGSDSPYVAWEYSEDFALDQGREINDSTVFVEDLSILDIIAIIGPVLFEDAMPQLIMPKNPDGTYAFHEGVQVLEFGAIVLREFITEIAPNVNYDAYIFANGDVTSADDRLFKDYDGDSDAWFNIILNMGLDVAYTYLNNITNFNTAIPAQNVTEARWKDMLGKVVTWAANYVGNGSVSIIHGFEPAKLDAYKDPLDKFSYVLNTLLPLGFICGCTEGEFDFNVSVVFDKLKALLTTFDLTELASLFGRNEEAYNILTTKNLMDMVLNLVNGIVNLILPISENGNGYTGLLQGVGTKSLDNIVTQKNLEITIQQLLRALNKQGKDLLTCALPIVGMFIDGWGTEQEFVEPDIALEKSVDLTNGATTEAKTVTIRNASKGVWRHYRDAAGNEYTDNQYKIKLDSVVVYDQLDETTPKSDYVTPSFTKDATADYGQSISFSYTVKGVPDEGALVRFKVGYKVIDEDNQEMADGKVFYTEAYTWLNKNGTDAGATTEKKSSKGTVKTRLHSPHYVALSTAEMDIPELQTTSVIREYKVISSGGRHDVAIEPINATVDGITFGKFKLNVGNGDHEWNNMTNFKNYTHQDSEDDSSDYAVNIAGSVAADGAYKKKTSGATTTFDINLKPDTGTTQKAQLVIRYYDDVALSKLTSLASSEMGALRLASTYNLEGKVYTGLVIEDTNTTDDKGEIVYRETNFKSSVAANVAWIADDDAGTWVDKNGKTVDGETVTEYNASAVTTTDEEGTVGYVMDGDKKINVRKVTVIDCATAVNNYVAAFLSGVRGAMQSHRSNSLWDFEALYEALYVASNDVSYCKKSAVQLVKEGQGDSIDATVVALKAALDASEAQYSDTKDYTDYKMYRWNRYNDARDDAAYYINLMNDASNATVDEIDETFPYTWINEDDLRTLVKGDKYANYIVALLEKMDAEEREATAKWLADKKTEYQTRQVLDVEMAANYLAKMGPRLLARDHGVITTYLADEITSAKNMVGASSLYTTGSWDNYAAALENAEKVLANPTQMTVFDAKYNLLVARNSLVLTENKAEYSELEALIAQARQALANASLYNNTDKEFGQVLAELGYDAFVNTDGDEIQLFPGNALEVVARAYGADDQNKIDRAATELKEALARLKFKGANVTYNGTGATDGVIVPGNEEEGIEAIMAKISVVESAQTVSMAVADFAATFKDGAVKAEDIVITTDDNYSVDAEEMAFVGTNATVTFYTTVGDVKIPVATVKVVVNGDVNGDGVVDVIDAAYATLVSVDKGELEGCYFLAANLDAASEKIVADDISAIVNIALA